jgi:hypothetical protein
MKNERIEYSINGAPNYSYVYDYLHMYNSEFHAKLYEFLKAVDKSGVIDFNLPSGNLWANSNLGAESVFHFGDYFTLRDSRSEQPEYNNIGVTQFKCNYTDFTKTTDVAFIKLKSNEDIVRKKLGKLWVIPNEKDVIELFEHTIQFEYTVNNVRGMLFAAKLDVKGNLDSSKVLFFPYGGYFADITWQEKTLREKSFSFYCWLNGTHAVYSDFVKYFTNNRQAFNTTAEDNTKFYRMSSAYRGCAFNIRPIMKKRKKIHNFD